MTAKARLHALVDEMTEDEASDLLDLLTMQDESDELTEADIAAALEGRAAFARGDYITQAEFEAKYGVSR